MHQRAWGGLLPGEFRWQWILQIETLHQSFPPCPTTTPPGQRNSTVGLPPAHRFMSHFSKAHGFWRCLLTRHFFFPSFSLFFQLLSTFWAERSLVLFFPSKCFPSLVNPDKGFCGALLSRFPQTRQVAERCVGAHCLEASGGYTWWHIGNQGLSPDLYMTGGCLFVFERNKGRNERRQSFRFQKHFPNPFHPPQNRECAWACPEKTNPSALACRTLLYTFQ